MPPAGDEFRAAGAEGGNADARAPAWTYCIQESTPRSATRFLDRLIDD